jgi:DNA-binding CsgD family transcriptional regulator
VIRLFESMGGRDGCPDEGSPDSERVPGDLPAKPTADQLAYAKAGFDRDLASPFPRDLRGQGLITYGKRDGQLIRAVRKMVANATISGADPSRQAELTEELFARTLTEITASFEAGKFRPVLEFEPDGKPNDRAIASAVSYAKRQAGWQWSAMAAAWHEDRDHIATKAARDGTSLGNYLWSGDHWDGRNDRLGDAMEFLSAKQRRVVEFVRRGFTDDEIADALGTTKGGAASLRSRAVKRLKAALAGTLPSPQRAPRERKDYPALNTTLRRESYPRGALAGLVEEQAAERKAELAARRWALNAELLDPMGPPMPARTQMGFVEQHAYPIRIPSYSTTGALSWLRKQPRKDDGQADVEPVSFGDDAVILWLDHVEHVVTLRAGLPLETNAGEDLAWNSDITGARGLQETWRRRIHPADLQRWKPPTVEELPFDVRRLPINAPSGRPRFPGGFVEGECHRAGG